MPHQKRHTRKARKPKRTQAMGDLGTEGLKLHRELRMLAVAGNAKPGKHRKKLLAKRMAKLDQSEAQYASEAQAVAEQETRMRETFRYAKDLQRQWRKKGRPEHSCIMASQRICDILICEECGAYIELEAE